MKDQIDDIFSDILLNIESGEGIAENFLLDFVNRVLIDLGNSYVSPNKELGDCLEKVIQSLNAYENTTNNIKKLTKDELPSINKIIEKSENAEMKSASKKLTNLQQNLQNQLNEADLNIKNFKKHLVEMKNKNKLDELTKTFNLKTFREDIEFILSSGLKRKLDLSLILIELSNLNEIKDKYGKKALEKTLIYLTKLLKSLTRSENKIYRYSNNTFFIVLNRSKFIDLVNTHKRIIYKLNHQRVVFGDTPIDLKIKSAKVSHSKSDTFNSLIDRLKGDKKLFKETVVQ